MGRLTAALLLAGCATLQGWAQAPSGQRPPEQAPAAEQKSADQNHKPEQTPDNHPAVPASSGEQATTTPPEQSGFPLDQFQEFSAIMTGGVLPMSDWDGYIYRSGKLMRMQRDTPQPSYFITDLAKQQTHGLAASGCIKLNYPYSRAFPFFLSGPGYKYERVPAGEETVDGHVCRVEDITILAPKHPQPLKIRLWEAEDLQGFPVKIENRRANAARWSIHYKNVVLGPQDPTLFVVPDTCQSSAGFVRPTPKPKTAPAGKPQ